MHKKTREFIKTHTKKTKANHQFNEKTSPGSSSWVTIVSEEECKGKSVSIRKIFQNFQIKKKLNKGLGFFIKVTF